ncbi:DedA family protein [Horticoccus sp. 23ND18S-11]|uniref:DedA family protein n=1 Tax=Horticoccus sp. 23ND18S-11 TaxID=3391832 RepID=UPI0039C9C4DD
MPDWFESVLREAGAGGPLALAALALATLVSEDLACIAAGLLVARGGLNFGAATAACGVGIFAGDLLLVLAGRGLGRPALGAKPLQRWIPAEAVARAERWFGRRGPGLILASRFMPGTRLPTYFAAGVLRAPLAPFVGWFLLASAVWTPLLVGGAVVLGESALRLLETWTQAVPALIGAGVVVGVGLRLVVSFSTWRGRRLLLSRWRRLTRWEFWPMWAVYPPVIGYILWLGVRHRSFTLFTLANPGIGAGGGLAGESKSSILRGLAGAGNAVVPWALISAGAPDARTAQVVGFMRRVGREFPVVLKPDVGERGRGVVIVRDGAALTAALTHAAAPMIAQAYVPGVEFGVFYVRRPTAARGEIFSITAKHLVAVVGDGERTLEELILADDRAVCMARFFLRHHEARLDEVPAAGASVVLSELGTHSRGALFLDGTHLVTPALTIAIEQVSRAHAGFYFGRYDVRTASVEAFQRGEFTVIELNGLTSESTSIYDPRHNVWFGWRVLCRQWRLAFDIAAENRARGAKPLTLREVMALVAAHTRSP